MNTTRTTAANSSIDALALLVRDVVFRFGRFRQAFSTSSVDGCRWRSEHLDAELGTDLGDVTRIDLRRLGQDRVVGRCAQRCNETFELGGRTHLKYLSCFGPDLERVRTAAGKPDHGAGGVHGFGVRT